MDADKIEEMPDVNEQAIGVLYYKANSVSWWWSKAVNYRDALGRAWDALRDAGIQSGGDRTVADAIKEQADLITAQAAQIEELVGALRLISDYAKKLRKGTNDWFDLVEIEAMATAALSRVKREGKR